LSFLSVFVPVVVICRKRSVKTGMWTTEKNETTACTACAACDGKPPKQAKERRQGPPNPPWNLFSSNLGVNTKRIKNGRMRWHAAPFDSGKRAFHDEQRAQRKGAVMGTEWMVKKERRRKEEESDDKMLGDKMKQKKGRIGW
jgi:hypothetical protein